MRRSFFIELICGLLILLFVYTGLSKLLDYNNFHLQLGKSPFITAFADSVAWSLPTGEILVALALMFRKTRLLGLYTSLFLMTMFTVYIYAMLRYSYDLPCSCGGVISKMSWSQHLWFNTGFVVLSVAGILLQSTKAIQSGPQPTETKEELPPVVYTAMS
ncbi:MAG: MauE/DoxX family redox-associated membrane protein [Bacteroidota bacterium]